MSSACRQTLGLRVFGRRQTQFQRISLPEETVPRQSYISRPLPSTGEGLMARIWNSTESDQFSSLCSKVDVAKLAIAKGFREQARANGLAGLDRHDDASPFGWRRKRWSPRMRTTSNPACCDDSMSCFPVQRGSLLTRQP